MLFYKITVDNGIVTKGDIVIPTGQNQANIEKNIGTLIQENIAEKKDEIEFKVEKLIRAYDPCMSCASHFLKFKWVTDAVGQSRFEVPR